MAAGKVEILLVVGGFYVNEGAEARLVKKSQYPGRGDDPSKSDRVATIEALKEEEKGIMTMSPQQ